MCNRHKIRIVRTFSEPIPFLNVAESAFPLVVAITVKAIVIVVGGVTVAVFARIGTATVGHLFAAGEPFVAVRARALIACWGIIVTTAGATVHARIGRATSQASGAGRARPAISTSASI
jgi:hypothetical protein